MEQAFEAVKKLVEDFKAHESDYLSPIYQESQVRQDFIDKFFTALGWDVTHERQKNPHEYEVQIENRIQGGSQQKADYAFFLAPNFRDPKFYVEAKKPSRQLKNPDFFFQTMSYGWPKNTPIGVLTDFEDLYIIDCRLKPSIKDALNRELESFHYTDYADKEKFAWIYYLLSHEAVADRAIEKFAAQLSKPKGKAVRGVVTPFDEAFLIELDGFRESLAKAFKKANQELDGEELTEAVQRTIDRLVFIRFLEDKLIEPEKEIVNLIDRQMAWDIFISHCKKLDPQYNGLIFKPHRIDNKDFNPPDEEVFQQLCEKLAGRESPYNFAQIPISILGSIYERFLGKVVHATDKRVKVEEKPEVRKAGGVYYTPDYIVRYIVKETVGKLIEEKTPEEISKMAFADIACGSGSFLIEVYNTLLEYHERYYEEHPDKAKKADLEQREGRRVLSLKKRQEILVNNIYGVDIDYQATEVTQLSLYLKLLEDVTTNVAYQFSLLKEKILPDLRNNIVCGNSLIGRDIVEGNLFPDVDESKLKPMNFEDAFPEVMKQGGFDAVVGNPPYVRIQGLQGSEQIEYLSGHYESAGSGNYDVYVVFAEKALELISRAGKVGLILPHKFFNAKYGYPLRQLIANGQNLDHIVHFGDKQVFKGATTYTCLLFLNKQPKEEFCFTKVEDLDLWKINGDGQVESISISAVTGNEWNFAIGESAALLSRLESFPIKLGGIAHIFVGLQTSADTVFLFKQVQKTAGKLTEVFSKELEKMVSVESALLKPVVRSGEIGRYNGRSSALVLFPYSINENGATLLPEKELETRYPQTWKYLLQNKKLLANREHGKFKSSCWYQLYPKNLELWEQPKILVPYMVTELAAFLDSRNLYFVNVTTGGFGVTIPSMYGDMRFFTGLLNSKLLNWYMKKISTPFHGGYFAANKQFLERLPICTIDHSIPEGLMKYEQVIQLVERMLAAKEELSKVKTEAGTTRLERECEALDRQIDQAVYELYSLTEEEIKVVEGK